METKKAPWYLSRKAVIGGLLLVGPLAIPLLWFSPEFKTRTKLLLFVLVVVLTVISAIYTPKLIDILASRVEEIQGVVKS